MVSKTGRLVSLARSVSVGKCVGATKTNKAWGSRLFDNFKVDTWYTQFVPVNPSEFDNPDEDRHFWGPI